MELAGDLMTRAARGVGREFLTAAGKLEKIGRFWHLTNPRDVASAGTKPPSRQSGP